jgi:hypothetical protein
VKQSIEHREHSFVVEEQTQSEPGFLTHALDPSPYTRKENKHKVLHAAV